MTTWQGWTYSYDADNRLVAASKSGNSYTLAYDAQGRLAKFTRNGAAEYRYFDGAQLFLRKDSGGATIERVIWGPAPDETLARWTAAGGWHYFHHDPLNSPLALTNASGTVIERYLYDAFGMDLIYDAAGTSRASSIVGNPWLFTGQEWMPELGLHNYKNRFYSDDLGRFLQQDPIRFDAGDFNLYRYCGNNPINASDPDGMFWDPDSGVWGLTQYAEFAKGMFVDPAKETFDTGAAHMEAGFQNIADGNYVEGALNVVAAVGKTAEVALDVTQVGKGATKAVSLGEKAVAAAVDKGAGVLNVAGKATGAAFKAGENATTKAGRAAHQEFAEKVKQKPGWKSEPSLTDPKTGKTVKPDALTPSGKPVELKPNTPSGRAKGKQQMEKYERAAGKSGRVVYYEPKR